MGDSEMEQHGEQLLSGLDSGQRDALRMLFREFRTRNTFAIRRGATRKANKEKCRRFLGDYKALSGEKERDALAVTAMLDALQPADNPGCPITMGAFVEGLGQVVSQGGQPDSETGVASVQDRLSSWIEGCARPILEEQIPPKYWQAMLRVKQALSASTDGQLVALLRRNNAAVKKLFDSEAMGVGGIGRLGRGKALTVQQMHQIFLRCSVQGPWLSMHGTDLIISLVKAWSSADSSKTVSHAPDDSLVEEDNAITKQEFTRCLMMAAHVMYCGGMLPGKGVGGVGDNVHDALLSLFAEMESSELCRHLGVRFSGVGGAKIKNVLPRSTDGLVSTASSGTPRAVHGTPSHTSRETSRPLASAASNVPPLASPAVEPRKTPLHAQKRSPARPASHTPISGNNSTPAHTPVATKATPFRSSDEQAAGQGSDFHSPRFDAVRRTLSQAVSASGQKPSRPVSQDDALLAAQRLRNALGTPSRSAHAAREVVSAVADTTAGSHTQPVAYRLSATERVCAQDEAIMQQLRDILGSDRKLFDKKMHTARDLFDQMDRDGNGLIDVQELHRAFQRLDVGVSAMQLDHLVKLIDADNNGTIDYRELLNALYGAAPMRDAASNGLATSSAEITESTEHAIGNRLHTAHEQLLATAQERRRHALAQLTKGQEQLKHALGEAADPDNSPASQQFGLPQEDEQATAEENTARQRLHELLDAQTQAARKLESLQQSLLEAETERENAKKSAHEWRKSAAEAEDVARTLEEDIQSRSDQIAALERDYAARLRQEAMQASDGNRRSPHKSEVDASAAVQANPPKPSNTLNKHVAVQAFSSELPSFKKAIEEQKTRYDEACATLKRRLGAEQAKDSKLRMAAERGQTLAEREVERLGQRCGGLTKDVSALREVHGELRDWVLEMFEIQGTEVTRTMLLLQLECERRVSAANEVAAACQAALAKSASSEEEGLQDLRRVVSELEASKEVEIAALRSHFDAEQQSLTGALEVAAAELAAEKQKSSSLAETALAAEARAVEAEQAAMDALQLAADAEKMVGEAKEAEKVAREAEAAARAVAQEAEGAARLFEIEAEVESKVASAATAEGKVMLTQVHELASEIGTFLEKQKLFQEQRAQANRVAKAAGSDIRAAATTESVRAEMDKVNGMLQAMQAAQAQQAQQAAADSLAQAEAETTVQKEIEAATAQLQQLRAAEAEARRQLQLTQDNAAKAKTEAARLASDLEHKAARLLDMEREDAARLKRRKAQLMQEEQETAERVARQQELERQLEELEEEQDLRLHALETAGATGRAHREDHSDQGDSGVGALQEDPDVVQAIEAAVATTLNGGISSGTSNLSSSGPKSTLQAALVATVVAFLAVMLGVLAHSGQGYAYLPTSDGE